MLRFYTPFLLCIFSGFIIAGCSGPSDLSGTNTFADMTPEDWEEYNAEQALLAKEAEQAMKEK
ncbi:hypothetical protein [Rhodopirellula sp. SWK7]|uniref:hypothetical protein n=1 Tax=Rhodopirellula sp. SWK7 TaxID=595460 RepID=UPI0002BE4A02|nr:hypothetical protein [Rhodopirellula sp. SWK7]EMI45343.1 secreted protein [Rhodopirellula sp. SWK7]